MGVTRLSALTVAAAGTAPVDGAAGLIGAFGGGPFGIGTGRGPPNG